MCVYVGMASARSLSRSRYVRVEVKVILTRGEILVARGNRFTGVNVRGRSIWTSQSRRQLCAVILLHDSKRMAFCRLGPGSRQFEPADVFPFITRMLLVPRDHPPIRNSSSRAIPETSFREMILFYCLIPFDLSSPL